MTLARFADLSCDEALALPALAARGDEYVHRYRKALGSARRAILERLFSALVREGLSHEPKTVRRRSLNHEAIEHYDVVFQGPKGQLSVELTKATLTGRFALAGLPSFWDGKTTVAVTDPACAVQLLGKAGVFSTYQPLETPTEIGCSTPVGQVAADMADSVRNYALTLTGAGMRSDRLVAEAIRYGVGTALDWARHWAKEDPSFSPLAFFEQLVVDGHPLHPGAKIRLGLSPEEVIRHSPEWGVTLRLGVAAIRRRRVNEGDPEVPFDDLFAAQYPELALRAAELLRHQALSPEEYVLVPVHPWQAERTLPKIFKAPLARQDVVLLSGLGISAKPLMSFRTMAPIPRADLACPLHLKTAVEVQLTSAVRGVSAHAVHNGPRVSALLREIIARESRLADRLRVLEELATVGYRPTSGDHKRTGHALGAVARTNPEQGLGPDVLAMPVAALYARSPLTGGPILAELLGELGAQHPGDDRSGTAHRFARVYAALTVEPLLTLLTRYGIALEAHPQNTVAMFRGGAPIGLAVRDFGAIRIAKHRLAAQGLAVSLAPDSAVCASDEDELRNKLFFSFFVNHLGELLSCLSTVGGCAEEGLWAPFAQAARQTFAELRRDPIVTEQAHRDSHALLNQPLPLKKVLTMRLTDAVTNESFVFAPNPLRMEVSGQ